MGFGRAGGLESEKATDARRAETPLAPAPTIRVRRRMESGMDEDFGQAVKDVLAAFKGIAVEVGALNVVVAALVMRSGISADELIKLTDEVMGKRLAGRTMANPSDAAFRDAILQLLSGAQLPKPHDGSQHSPSGVPSEPPAQPHPGRKP